jgi:hypothetical protein
VALLLPDDWKQEDESIGRLAFYLKRIARAAIPITPTALIPGCCYSDYLSGKIPDIVIGSVVDAMRAEVQAPGLVLKASLSNEAIWYLADVRTGNSRSELRNALDRLYRSFATPRSRATRVARGVSEDTFSPAVVVQPDFPYVGSVLSRHAITGLPVDISNWQDNVNNQLPTDDAHPCLSLCRAAETAVGEPLYASFTRRADDPVIADASPATITPTAD